MVTNYQEAKIQNREALRRGLLDAAGRVLVAEGLEALTMRRVAQEVQASTKVLYTLFGSKEGLLEQLYVEGFARMGRDLAAVPVSADPLVDLVQLAQVYRQTCLANPTYFAILFGQAGTQFKPSVKTIQEAIQVFEALLQRVVSCQEQGIFGPGDPEITAKIFWGSFHGIISLELSGYYPDLDEAGCQRVFDLTVQNTLKGLQRQP